MKTDIIIVKLLYLIIRTHCWDSQRHKARIPGTNLLNNAVIPELSLSKGPKPDIGSQLKYNNSFVREALGDAD